MLLRHLGAFRKATKSLEQYYENLKASGSSAISSKYNPTFPYPTSYTSGLTEHTFTYLSELPSEHNFVFFGRLDSNDQKLCIKFTHQYGEDVHRFCAEKGHAPRLRAIQRLPGGFYMVVMDDIGEEYIDLHIFVEDHPEIRSSSAYTDLKDNIRRFLEKMHQAGWVHGDLRSTNVMVKKSGLDGSFLFIDFDWSGKNQEVVYPSFLNTTGVQRPEGADDGEPILALHDVEMLSYF
jgi:serine/threonine protein kinase